MAISTGFINELKHESSNTRKLLKLMPDDKLDWQPHERSMKLGRLATHIGELPVWIVRIVTGNEFDFATAAFASASPNSATEILEVFESHLANAVAALEQASDEHLNSNWLARRGELVMFNQTRKSAIRNFTLNHIYHHRGQLTVFLRLLDIPIPGLYGPSADERR